jgi:hypothetical protein
MGGRGASTSKGDMDAIFQPRPYGAIPGRPPGWSAPQRAAVVNKAPWHGAVCAPGERGFPMSLVTLMWTLCANQGGGRKTMSCGQPLAGARWRRTRYRAAAAALSVAVLHASCVGAGGFEPCSRSSLGRRSQLRDPWCRKSNFYNLAVLRRLRTVSCAKHNCNANRGARSRTTKPLICACIRPRAYHLDCRCSPRPPVRLALA